MRSLFAACLISAAALGEVMDNREFEFMHWIAKWNKSYGTREEYRLRLAEWLKVDEFVKEVNAPDSEYTHTATHNHFSDFTRDEFKRMMTLKDNKVDLPADHVTLDAPEGYVPNGSVDWRNNGCVTAVKNQGSCGSCYAFSATETVESSYCVNHGHLYTLSPQQIVDCSTAYGN